MKLPKQIYRGDLAPFEKGSLWLPAELHEDTTRHGKGVKKNIYLTGREDVKRVKKDPHGRDVTKLSFREFDDGRALFLGMSICHRLRGRGLGGPLLKYFLEAMNAQSLEFAGTGKMHKPLVALLLKREGLEPQTNDFVVEILPYEKQSPPDVPSVRFLRRIGPPEEIVAESSNGPFYEEVCSDARQLQPLNPNRVVALHTSYRITA